MNENLTKEALLPPVAVVIPTYRALASIMDVLSRIGPSVTHIYVVDDCCPEKTGDLVSAQCLDGRVKIIRHDVNQGVGGAVMTGYLAAIADGAQVIVKIDSDGQMDPALIDSFVRPILSGDADYTKGNRFFSAATIVGMPRRRIFGNAILSLMSKFSTGYWNVFDPTNGYTAIHANVAALLPFDMINRRYFSETDMLYFLGIFRAEVHDIPMFSHYGDERSGLKISHIVGQFLALHISRFFKRILSQYFVRDFSFASLCLLIGAPLLFFGVGYGAFTWWHAYQSGVATPIGTVMLVTLPTILGTQFVLTFFAADIAASPRRAIHRSLPKRTVLPLTQFRG